MLRRRSLVTAWALMMLLVVPWSPRQAYAYPSAAVELEGHGWGHGRGMGQYGALGYALDHGWDYGRILSHFYSNTAAGTIGNIPMSVRMTRVDSLDTIVQQERGHLRTNADGGGGLHTALRASRIGANTFRVDFASGCGGPWTTMTTMTGPVAFYPDIRSDVREEMLQLCEPGASRRWLRGDLHAVDDGGTQRTVNHLAIEDYLRGVVPRESPASWGDLGGGAGMHALRAQSVAARSYGASENRYGYAKSCDTTACQVYSGRAVQDNSGFRNLEDARTDRAIAETSGQVRLLSGVPARTEFSSSTGGYTAGGTFPSVPDDGDKISLNPNHLWKASIPVAVVEAAWPQIGRLATFQVTERNGLGDWGGRVRRVLIEGSAGRVTPTGDEVRQRLGLKSNWFRLPYPGGYWIVGTDGGVFTFGNASFYGSTGGITLNQPIVGMEALPSKTGYWLVATDGGIFTFGEALFYGSAGGIKLNRPIVGMSGTPSGGGYWLVANDGGIFSYGNARFFGSTGAIRLNQPIVGMAPTPSGDGYWLVASDGGIFSFGDAGFHGSTGAIRLNQPIVGMAATPSGGGYWLVASDGGIFAFGDAAFFGSTGSIKLNRPITGMAASPTGGGYYLVATDGGVFAFGDAQFFGSVPGVSPTSTTTKIDLVVSTMP